jgi:hypothetical protein
MSLQLATADGSLAEAEELLRRALGLWPGNIDALEEIAHFYDAVLDDHANAVKYAAQCRARAAALVASMDEILQERRG